MHLKLFSKKNEVTTLKDEDIQICKFRRCLQGIRENVDTLVKNMDGQDRRKINNYKKKLLAAFAEMYRKQLLYEVAIKEINQNTRMKVEYFRYVRTDGYWWYQISNNQVLGKVFDYKVAIIFELEKEIYSL